jgi:hypothetical protein
MKHPFEITKKVWNDFLWGKVLVRRKVKKFRCSAAKITL